MLRNTRQLRVTPAQRNRMPFLKVDSTAICTEDGKAISLRGTNLGGWLLQECWMSPAGDATIPGHSELIAQAFSHNGGEGPNAVVDNEDATRWSSGQPQAHGQWFEVDLGRSVTFNQVIIDAGDSHEDVPAGALVRLSHDGDVWWDVGWLAGDGPVQVLRFPHQTARHLQVVLINPRPDRWWSIAKLRVTVSDEFHTRSRLVERFGEAEALRLLKVYQNAWIDADDLDVLADIGFNCVRVPLDWQVIMSPDGLLRSEDLAFGRLDWLLSECEARGLYVILDLHGLPGGANPWHSSGRAGVNAFWRDQECQDRAETIWRAIARRYRGSSTVAAYDLINEPLVTMGEPEQQHDVALKFDVTDRLLRAVREEDPDHIVMVAVFPDWEHCLPPWERGWTNVVYQTHHYSFASQEHHDGMRGFVRHELSRLEDFRARWGVPVYAGEFWLGPFSDLYDLWLSELNRLGISWTSWTYKVKNGPTSRGPDGILNGVGWSLFYDNPNPAPDLDLDDAATIARKWARFSTRNFRPNPVMQAIYRRHADLSPERSWSR